MATNAERQRAFRARKRAEGFSSLTLLVPERHRAELELLAQRLRADPDLEVGSPRNSRTGRLEKLFKPD